jgi:formylglycine-generating enzyme required for sulfatase activity
MANTWQGEFPVENLELDGYAGSAPVGRFPANGYGLVEEIGNVWEWTGDWYQAHGELPHACGAVANPRGGDRERSADPPPSGAGS